MIRVVLPYHLRNIAGIPGEVTLEVPGPVTIGTVLNALETRYPMLKGTIRDHQSRQRRAFLRFFACEEDWSLEPADKPLPQDVADGRQPFMVVGGLAGG